MSVRFEWMHLPSVEFVPHGYDVREGQVFTDSEEFDDESTVTEGALLISGDECTVVTGDPESLHQWATSIVELLTCTRHGGVWGTDETCAQCTDSDGHPLVRSA